MFPKWRLKIREAKQALNHGRWDDASALLQGESVRDFLPAKRLSLQVASHLVGRARQRLQGGDTLRGWQDLQQAARLGGCDEKIAVLLESHARSGFDRVRQLLISGETVMASRQLLKLEQRRLGGDERRAWKSIVHLISQAKKLANRGELTEASVMLQRAIRLLPEPDDQLGAQIEARRTELDRQVDRLRSLSSQLHAALTAEEWTQVLTIAESLLELAPEHSAALQARRRAWQAVGLKATVAQSVIRAEQRKPRLNRSKKRPHAGSTHPWAGSAEVETGHMQRQQSKRMVAWIDEVGGFLICLGEEVILGQPAGSGGADIPLLADLSRRHATIRREAEAYVLTPIHQVSIDGQPLTIPTVLRNEALIELGAAVQLRFHKPHALSSTAVLTIETHHKIEPAVEAIVLMSESCILGPQKHSHIVCRDWAEDVVLFRRGEQVHIRSSAEVEIEGNLGESEDIITGNCRVVGEDFALSLEEL